MTALSNLSKALTERAETVCKHYLPNGNREGHSRVGAQEQAVGRDIAILKNFRLLRPGTARMQSLIVR